MTLSELKLHIAKTHWAAFKTGVTWDALDDHGRERYLHYASCILQSIWDAGCEVVPREMSDEMAEDAIAMLAFDISDIWGAALYANPLRRTL